jgi:S-adenosylmethionine:tRNA ribosyltransferase-isomerase
MYSPEDYNFDLPDELIAQQPLARRDQSRLLHLERSSGRLDHRRFSDLPDLLCAGDVLVLNDTRVVPGRLLGRKESGGKVEILILDPVGDAARQVYTCLVRASKRPLPGSCLFFDGGLVATVEAIDERTSQISFDGPAPLDQVLESIGHVPLPPYIRRDDNPDDRHTYQTVYANCKGAIAAPTAGLHFTPELLQGLRDKGVEVTFLTLHVGYGTFVPVRVDDIREHRMHSEWFDLGAQTVAAIARARENGHRVVAVGTTCVRTLEFCARNGALKPHSGACNLFIYPGFEFRVVDAMVTNFHLPRSTLMMLVSAFAGRDTILRAYSAAVQLRYRFFSYGDAMLIA